MFRARWLQTTTSESVRSKGHQTPATQITAHHVFCRQSASGQLPISSLTVVTVVHFNNTYYPRPAQWVLTLACTLISKALQGPDMVIYLSRAPPSLEG